MSTEKMSTDTALGKELRHLPVREKIAFLAKIAGDCVTNNILNLDFVRPATKSTELSIDLEEINSELEDSKRQLQDKKAEMHTHVSLPVRNLILTDEDREAWEIRLEKLELDKSRILKTIDQLLSIN